MTRTFTLMGWWPASAEPRDLVVSGSGTLTVRDVLVGEVWLASGQSNMAMSVNHSARSKEEVAAAKFPLVRHFNVSRKASVTPLGTAGGKWLPATSAHVAGFSAVAYHFSVAVHDRLNIPVGILHASWGGSAIDAWTDEDTLRASPGRARRLANTRKQLEGYPAAKARHEEVLAAWKTERDAAKAAGIPFKKSEPEPPVGPNNHTTMAGPYNGMIHPLVPYALRGVIWYQGEGNVRSASGYSSALADLVTGWRRVFSQGAFPFYWVQLPNFDIGGQNDRNWQWAELREAQTKALAVPNTAQAVTIDVGDAHQLHPANKKPVGRRLALLALARTYGAKDVIDSGPVFKSALREGAAYRVSFEPSVSPLKASGAGLPGFELAGEDRVFKPADARIDGATVVVSSAAVPAPAAVRYSYRNAPVAGLFNVEGLPASPFRTDDWPATSIKTPSTPEQ